MINKNRLKNFIAYNWYWYLIMLLFIAFIFYAIHDVRNTYKYDQSLKVFISAKTIDSVTIKESLKQGLDNEVIKDIDIDNSDPNDMYFNAVFNTRGMVNTDIIIIKDDYISGGSYNTYFIALDLNVLDDYLDTNSFEYFIDTDNVKYGIKINNYLKNYIETNDDNYYLFFNKSSTKIGNLSSNSINDQALKALLSINKQA